MPNCMNNAKILVNSLQASQFERRVLILNDYCYRQKPFKKINWIKSPVIPTILALLVTKFGTQKFIDLNLKQFDFLIVVDNFCY